MQVPEEVVLKLKMSAIKNKGKSELQTIHGNLQIAIDPSTTHSSKTFVSDASTVNENAIADEFQDASCKTIELSDFSVAFEPASQREECLVEHQVTEVSGRAKRGRGRKTLLTKCKIKREPCEELETPNRKRFCSSWFSIPELAPWLAESFYPNHAYCKFCKKDLLAGKSELYKHLRTSKHQRIAQKLGEYMPDMPDELTEIFMEDDMHLAGGREFSDPVTGVRPALKVRELEHSLADVLGKEAALFCHTGTMANVIALMAHCGAVEGGRAGGVVLAGDKSFVYRHCQPTLARMQGIAVRGLRNDIAGQVSLDKVRQLMQPPVTSDDEDPQPQPQLYEFSRPSVLCLENTHTYYGGQVLPDHFMVKTRQLCDEFSLQLHVDGARLLHAVYANGTSLTEEALHAHSVTLCFNKSLDAPYGSVIAGSASFIKKCALLLPLFCVSSIPMENLAAACLRSLSRYVQHVASAQLHARNIARGIARTACTAVTLQHVDHITNVLLLHCDGVRVTPQQLVHRLRKTPVTEVETLKSRVVIIAKVWNRNTVRLVTHSGLTAENVSAAIKKLKFVFAEYENILVLNYDTGRSEY